MKAGAMCWKTIFRVMTSRSHPDDSTSFTSCAGKETYITIREFKK